MSDFTYAKHSSRGDGIYSKCGRGDKSGSCSSAEGCSGTGSGCSTNTGEEIISDASRHQIDLINNPPHYNQGSIECIEAIKATLTPEEFRGYCKGNAVKYIWRERLKGQDESLKKATWYLDRLQNG
ncbi:DUF3310 domain-containing protein [bacterium]|nr:DUF3310 domain-containing protein [bacterium]